MSEIKRERIDQRESGLSIKWEYGVSDRPELVLKSESGEEKDRLTSKDVSTIERLGFLIDGEGDEEIVSFHMRKSVFAQEDEINEWKQKLVKIFGLQFKGMI